MEATGHFPVGCSWGVGVHLAELTVQETKHIQTAGKVRNRDGQHWELCLEMEWCLGVGDRLLYKDFTLCSLQKQCMCGAGGGDRVR